jgi:hypothetical protein
MPEKQKILISLAFPAAFALYVFCFWHLYQALLQQRAVFDLALYNVGISMVGVTLTGFVALSSSDVKHKKLLGFSRVFFILSIVSMLSFFELLSNWFTMILAMFGFLWILGALITNLVAISFYYKKIANWIYLVTEILWGIYCYYAMKLVVEISASC